MTLFNVLTAVVDLVEADTPEGAVDALRDRLIKCGFTVYETPGDAFESEPIDG